MNTITRLLIGSTLVLLVGCFAQDVSVEEKPVAGISTSFSNVPIGALAPAAVNVIVEIPQGTSNIYSYDEQTGMLKLMGRVAPTTKYPGEYGLIPRTSTEGGTALDALVLLAEPSYPGALLEARPIAVLHMILDDVREDTILMVPLFDKRYNGVTNVDDLPDYVRDSVAEFFRTFVNEDNEWVKVEGWGMAEEARQVILAAMERYNAK